MATNQNLSLSSILSDHGFASIDDARADNVFFACGACGSIKSCTPMPGRTREQEVADLIANYEGIDSCCEDGDDYLL